MNLKSNKAFAAPLTLGTILAFGSSLAWIFFCVIIYIILETGHVLSDDAFAGENGRACSAALLLLSPWMFGLFYFVMVPLAEYTNATNSSYLAQLHKVVPYAVTPFVVLCVIAAILTVVCYLRQRRYSKHGSLAWVIFVFLFGAPGLIGYLLHRRWPAKEKCANCGTTSPRDRDACLNCDTEFPLPALTGIEIFA